MFVFTDVGVCVSQCLSVSVSVGLHVSKSVCLLASSQIYIYITELFTFQGGNIAKPLYHYVTAKNITHLDVSVCRPKPTDKSIPQVPTTGLPASLSSRIS